MSEFGDPRAAFEKLYRFNGTGMPFALHALADAFQAEGVGAGIGPEIEQGKQPVGRRFGKEIKRPADLYAV